MHFCSKITSPEFIFGGVNFYSLGETSLSSHSVGFTLERLGKKAIFGPFLFIMLHCTVVNKGIIIEILDFELGAFSENLKHLMTWRKGIFGFSLQKKKF